MPPRPPEVRIEKAGVPASLLDPGPLPSIPAGNGPDGRLDAHQKGDLLLDTGSALMACRDKLGEIGKLVTPQ